MQPIVRLHYDLLIPLFNAVRFGISMYGLSPSPEMKPILPYDLKEAFSLKTKIVHVKQLSREIALVMERHIQRRKMNGLRLYQ